MPDIQAATRLKTYIINERLGILREDLYRIGSASCEELHFSWPRNSIVSAVGHNAMFRHPEIATRFKDLEMAVCAKYFYPCAVLQEPFVVQMRRSISSMDTSDSIIHLIVVLHFTCKEGGEVDATLERLQRSA